MKVLAEPRPARITEPRVRPFAERRSGTATPYRWAIAARVCPERTVWVRSAWDAAGCPTTTLTKFAAEMCVLKQVIAQFTSNVRIGLMMFAESGENGGYIRYAVRDVGPDNATSKANQDAFIAMLTNFKDQGTGTDNSGSNQPYGKVMFEAFKYFGGYTDPQHATVNNIPGVPIDRNHFGNERYGALDAKTDIAAWVNPK